MLLIVFCFLPFFSTIISLNNRSSSSAVAENSWSSVRLLESDHLLLLRIKKPAKSGQIKRTIRRRHRHRRQFPDIRVKDKALGKSYWNYVTKPPPRFNSSQNEQLDDDTQTEEQQYFVQALTDSPVPATTFTASISELPVDEPVEKFLVSDPYNDEKYRPVIISTVKLDEQDADQDAEENSAKKLLKNIIVYGAGDDHEEPELPEVRATPSLVEGAGLNEDQQSDRKEVGFFVFREHYKN